MHRNHFSIFLLCSLLMLVIPFGHAFSTPEAEPSKGAKIGTLIKDAITAAFPGVQSLVNLIFGPKDEARLKKQDVEKQLKETRSNTLKEAQNKLSTIDGVYQELFLLDQFLNPSVETMIRLTKISLVLESQSPDWSAVSTDWGVASAQLKKISNVQDNQLKKIGDLWLRDKLAHIRDSNNREVIEITDGIKNKNIAATRQSIKDLEVITRNIWAAVGYEVQNLEGAMAILSAWASGAAGIPKTTTFNYIKVLNDSYPSDHRLSKQ